MYLSSQQFNSTTLLGKDQNKKVMQVVQSLLDQPESYPFAQPVDWKTLGLLDYPQIVKHPMDLGTVRSKLQNSKYRTVEQCLDDIQLVWDCCKKYNPPGSWVTNLANKLEIQFKRLIKNYLSSLSISLKKSKNSQKKIQRAVDLQKDPIKIQKPLKKSQKSQAKANIAPVPVGGQKSLQSRLIQLVKYLSAHQLGVITNLLIKKEVKSEWCEDRLVFNLENIPEQVMKKLLEQMQLWGVAKTIPKKK